MREGGLCTIGRQRVGAGWLVGWLAADKRVSEQRAGLQESRGEGGRERMTERDNMCMCMCKTGVSGVSGRGHWGVCVYVCMYVCVSVQVRVCARVCGCAYMGVCIRHRAGR